MTITKGSRAAHERALKAAETRRRNADNRSRSAFVATYPELESDMAHVRSAPVTRKLRAVKNPRGTRKPPAFPTSYHATPTRKVTRDLKMKYPKARKLISLRGIRKASTEELEADFEYMNRPRRETGIANTSANDKRYYAIKDELRARASGNTALLYQRVGARDIGGKKVKKRQVRRASGSQKRPKRAGRRKSRSELYGF